jgi:hypothetical protein
MRVGPLLLSLALVVPAAHGAFAQTKKAPPAQHKKGARAPRPSHGAEPAAAGDKASSEGEPNPYGAPEPAVAPAASAPEAPAAPGDAPSPAPAPATDGKLDDTPPPKTDAAAGPKLSPLNPEANEFPKTTPGAAPAALDKLFADIATLRARVAALTTSLFSSKLRIYVHTEGSDARVQGFVVTLDDGTVFRADPGFIADDEKVVYEHAVAPGSHVVGIEVERQDARGAAFKTFQSSRFSIQVPERKVLEAIVDVTDDSDMASDFPDDQDGKYDLEIRLRAKVVR